ncbi:glutamyl aminopeptidase [Caerostris extrusa]|uniref:Glutamyl aminopeptidase n=1 Tax=Caerostris extrusa TaxID=172846 RepID=A0AAV4S7F5_CAEEX|nr:glutamyl aminopeptidase [Caerostris extrusa]
MPPVRFNCRFCTTAFQCGTSRVCAQGSTAPRRPPRKRTAKEPTSSPTSAPPLRIRSTPLPESQADAAGHTLQPEETPWLDFRLSKTVVPVHYDLLLHPDLKTDTFSGTVTIAVNVTKLTKHFVVHAYRLTILEVQVDDVQQNHAVPVEKQFAYNPHEYLVVSTEERVKPGSYKLRFKFGGTLNGSIIGFYKSRYKNAKNVTRYLATSNSSPPTPGGPSPVSTSLPSSYLLSVTGARGRLCGSLQHARTGDRTLFPRRFRTPCDQV